MPSSIAPDAPVDDLPSALRRYFGFDAFRPGQEEIVRRAVEGRDTLALMPTGAGKSLCYQLAAMLRPTPTVVLSPLIALMKDQVDNLPAAVSPHASLINSSLDPGEAARRLHGMVTGEYRLIYAAPERLRQRQFMTALKSMEIGLVVIDEVHCVSMWGHDFRPDYMFIRRALAALGEPAVLGMTATATPVTEQDIAASLGRDFEVVRTSVQRPNLRYDVRYVETADERLRTAVELARRSQGAGIIYARSREKCEQLAGLLRRRGVNALHYHAGLEAGERKRVQESFLQDRARVIVATTAFGMGIDKPDIRWIVLFDYPSSLEDYVQRVGRAGRDGEESVCALLAGAADATSLLRFARSDLPAIESLRTVYREVRARLQGGVTEIAGDELGAAAGLGEREDPRVLVGMLERAELVRRDFDAGRAMRIEVLPPPPDAPARIDALLRRYAQEAEVRARRMIAFAESDICRHLQVAQHFGETVAVPCGMCDVCAPSGSFREEMTPAARPLPDNIAATILEVVSGLSWPLGRTGLAKTLRGMVDAPPSAQRSRGYGILAAARPSVVDRWIQTLIEGGHLEQYRAQDGDFMLLRVGGRDNLPRFQSEGPAPARTRAAGRRDRPAGTARSDDPELGEADLELFESLRAWRADVARQKGVAAFVILSDRVLRGIVARRPETVTDLRDVSGMGPAKIESYGEEILALVRGRAEARASETNA